MGAAVVDYQRIRRQDLNPKDIFEVFFRGKAHQIPSFPDWRHMRRGQVAPP
jgi:hypothetical protein